MFRNVFTIRDFVNMAETFVSCFNKGIPIAKSIEHSISVSLFDAFGILESKIRFDRKDLIEKCVLEVI